MHTHQKLFLSCERGIERDDVVKGRENKIRRKRGEMQEGKEKEDGNFFYHGHMRICV